MQLSTLICKVILIAVSILITARRSLTAAEFSSRVTEKRILDNLLDPKNYDRRIRPNPNTNQTRDATRQAITDVISIEVHDIESLCSSKRELKLQLTLRQQWNDARLAYDSSGGEIQSLSLSDPSLIWSPDVYFANSANAERPGHQPFNGLIIIKPDGGVHYSERLSLTTSCPMNLADFPLDNQVCRIKIGAFELTPKDQIIAWRESNTVEIANKIRVPGFKIVDYKTDTHAGGSAISLSIEFQRTFSTYLTRVYIPCTFFLVLCYLSLWLRNEDQRFILSLISNVSLALFSALVSTSFPNASCTKAIDTWTGICQTFALVSLVLVTLVDRLPEGFIGPKETSTAEAAEEPMVRKGSRREFTQKVTRSRVESAARILYPSIFFAFLFAYFIVYGRRVSILENI